MGKQEAALSSPSNASGRRAMSHENVERSVRTPFTGESPASDAGYRIAAALTTSWEDDGCS